MNPAEDVSPYYIEDTHLLKFLIKRYGEMLQMEQPRLVSGCESVQIDQESLPKVWRTSSLSLVPGLSADR